MSERQTLIEKLDSALDGFEQKVGLPDYEPDNEVHRYLNMKRNELEKLTPDECGEAAFLLRKFAFHLQRAYGRETARVKFLDRQIRKTVASEVSQYRAPSADERRDLAIKGNEHARELARHRDFHEAKMDRLAFLSNCVGQMAGSLDELQATKRRQRSS
jgi:hypothetical protein